MWRGIRSCCNSTGAMCRARSQGTLCSAGSPASAATARLSELHFPKLAARAERSSEIASIALDLLKERRFTRRDCGRIQQRALEQLSFQAVRSQLAKVFAQFAQGER